MNMNPYLPPTIPTGIAEFLVRNVEIYELPFYSLEDESYLYTVFHTGRAFGYKTNQYLLSLTSLANSGLTFYMLNTGFQVTLLSVEPQTNRLSLGLENLRNAYYLVYKDQRIFLEHSVTNIQELQNFSSALFLLCSLPTLSVVLWGRIILHYTYTTGKTQRFYPRLVFVFAASKSGGWENNIEFDFCGNTLIGYFRGGRNHRLFLCNDLYFLNVNNVLYLNYGPDLRILLGGRKDFVLRPSGSTGLIGECCDFQEIYELLPEIEGSVIDYLPVKTLKVFVSNPSQGRFYLYGFLDVTGYNNGSSDVFFMKLAGTEYLNDQLTILSLLIRCEFVDTRPDPQYLVYAEDGLEVYYVPDVFEIGYLIYRPTFETVYLPNFVASEFSIQGLSY